MREALADVPPIPFRAPPGIKLVRVNHKTGLPAGPGDKTAILEAFKPGEEPAGSVAEDMGDDSDRSRATISNTGAAAGGCRGRCRAAARCRACWTGDPRPAPLPRPRPTAPPPPPSNALTAGPGGLY